MLIRITRRALVGSAATLPVMSLARYPILAPSVQAAEMKWRHGISLFGDLKYPPGFAHFAYVYPKAPKGGRARQIALGTFDNFNMIVAGVKGALVAGIALTSDTLMRSALDEASTEYGLLAEGVRLSR